MYDITRWVCGMGGGGAWVAPLLCPPPFFFLYSRETYNSLAAWLTDARTLASPNIVVILCGNKKDLDPEREVTFLEASRFAQENELMFLETSALTGENVEEAFLKCARTILNKIDSGEAPTSRDGSGRQGQVVSKGLVLTSPLPGRRARPREDGLRHSVW